MTYASVDDLKAVVPAADLSLLTDHDGVSDVIVEQRIVGALEDATAEVDGYIAKQVTLPLENPPRMLMVCCRDIALHRLYANIGHITATQDKLREGAIQYLRSVADGKLSIGDETSGDEIQTSPGAIVIEGPARVMTRETLKSF